MSTNQRNGETSEKEQSEVKHLRDFSQLPPRILEMIFFDYLKKGDGSIKALAGTCKAFNEILVARLVLRLDFDKIRFENKCPKVQRKYTEIKILGLDIKEKKRRIQKMLGSSQVSAKSLFIGLDFRYGNLKIKLQTLLFVLEILPNIKSLHIKNLITYQLTNMKDKDYPKLATLKTLQMNYISTRTMSVFQKVDGLEELEAISLCSDNDIRTFVRAQKNLKILRANGLMSLEKDSLPSLTTFECYDNALDFNFLDFAPNLENLRLRCPFCNNLPLSILQYKSNSMKSIEISGSTNEHFHIEQLIESYPNLQTFKSSNFLWKKS